jgi:malonyl-CoA O-methyltransferase
MTNEGAHPDQEASLLDRRAVRRAFERSSSTARETFALQTQVREELLGRLIPFALNPRVVLDLGAGTGEGTRVLKDRYRAALVIAVDLSSGLLQAARRQQRLWRRFARACADAQRLPLASASVDLVFSNLMLPWCQPLDDALSEIARVLKPGGFFAFSTLGPMTLQELREAWAQIDRLPHVNLFTDVHDLGAALVRAGLSEPVLDVDRIEWPYSDLHSLMHELQASGARNLTVGRSRGLLGRRRLAALQRVYETHRRNGSLPATYEVIYGAAWGAEPREVIAHETAVPVHAIGRRRLS